MKKKPLSALLVLVMIVLLMTPAVGASAEQSSQEQATIDAGALFQEHCAKCHGDDGRAHNFRGILLFAQNLTNPHWQTLVKDEQLSDAIKEGPGLMPSFGNTLSQGEIDALVDFIRSLKIAGENS